MDLLIEWFAQLAVRKACCMLHGNSLFAWSQSRRSSASRKILMLPRNLGKFEHRALGTFPLTMRHSCVASMSSADHSTSLRSGIHGFTVRGLADVANPVSKNTQPPAVYRTSSLKDLGLETSLSDSSRIDPSLTPFEHITTRFCIQVNGGSLRRSDVVLLPIHSLFSTEYYH